eukprot:2571716-Rhodomonas_salina.1
MRNYGVCTRGYSDTTVKTSTGTKAQFLEYRAKKLHSRAEPQIWSSDNCVLRFPPVVSNSTAKANLTTYSEAIP